MNLKLGNYKNIYFLGIGGVGVSALAFWSLIKNFHIGGYDREKNNFTSKLELKGVKIQYNLSEKKISKEFLNNTDTLIVHTSAINIENPLYRFFYNHKFNIIKRSQFLGLICADYIVIAIAGTHGKTTVSIMLSHILKTANYHPNAFFGGIATNYDSNFLMGNSDYIVVEADEYDKSFLELSPHLLLITSIDKDHVDTYESEDALMRAYYQLFVNTSKKCLNTKKMNAVFINSPVFMPALVKKKFMYYIDNNLNLDFVKEDIKEPQECGVSNFNLSVVQHMPAHNIKNAIMSAQIANKLGVSKLIIEKAFKTFMGVKRRFEYHVNTNKLILIDDYAHHPNELKELIKSARKLYPDKKLFLIFQPHLFSRTKDLEYDFINILSLVDKLILLDIYPAREKPISGVSSKNLLQKINLKYKWCVKFSDVSNILKTQKPNFIITAGAGDINKLIPLIKSILT